MENWRNIGLSVIQKANIFEYHAIYFIKALNGLGDKTTYFIDSTHKNGALQDRHTQILRDNKQKHESQYKADH